MEWYSKQMYYSPIELIIFARNLLNVLGLLLETQRNLKMDCVLKRCIILWLDHYQSTAQSFGVLLKQV